MNPNLAKITTIANTLIIGGVIVTILSVMFLFQTVAVMGAIFLTGTMVVGCVSIFFGLLSIVIRCAVRPPSVQNIINTHSVPAPPPEYVPAQAPYPYG